MVGISIEHERLDPRCEKTRSDAPLRRLAPPGMRHLRINVCIETVFAGRRLGPTGHGLPLGEPDLHNGFYGFETVLPGNHNQYRPAILLGQKGRVTWRDRVRKAEENQVVRE